MTSLLFHEIKKNERVVELSHLDVPFRLIWAGLILNRVAKDLASKRRTALLVFLPSGHWPQIAQPDDVARLMLAEK